MNFYNPDEPESLEDLYDYDDIYDPSWDTCELPPKDLFTVGVARVPLILLRSITQLLRGNVTLPRAWMLAIAEKFPKTSFGELRSTDPSLIPPWLLDGFASYQEVLVLRREGIFARLSARKYPCFKASAKSLSILAATSGKCRFREGFAPEGMLCNNPPIPLRVLDFLEHAEDLLNLALVCKATHQAGHVLLQREFPTGVGPGLVTHDGMVRAITRRKQNMLESALRHPISSPASDSTTATATEGEGCAGTDAEEADHVHEDILITVRRDERKTDELDWCMLTLLWANALAAAGRSGGGWRPRASHQCHKHESDIACEWRLLQHSGLPGGIVLDAEAVGMAIAHWDVLNIKEPDQSSGQAATDAQHVMRMLRAAERHGQGVIVHRNCTRNPGRPKVSLWLRR